MEAILAVNIEADFEREIILKDMQLENTQFLKMMELYLKINIRLSLRNILSLKTLKLSSICFHAVFILYLIYLVLNPIFAIAHFIQIEGKTKNQLFIYMYQIFAQCFLSMYNLVKIFRNSNEEQVIKTFGELLIDEDDRIFYNCKSIYSRKLLSAVLGFFIIIYLIMFIIVLYINSDFQSFISYPFPYKNSFDWLIITMYALFNTISITSMIFDLYMQYAMRTALIYEFNKTANEAQRYVEIKQPNISYFFQKHKDITEICNTHDILSTILKLLNESYQLQSGFIVLTSIGGCCIATYGVINSSFQQISITYIYVLYMISCGLTFLMITVWIGIRLNNSVSYTTYLYNS